MADGEVPEHLAASLTDAADVADQLDRRMEQLHHEVLDAETDREDDPATIDGVDQELLMRLWERSQDTPQRSTDTTTAT